MTPVVASRHVMPLGPILREADARVKDKSDMTEDMFVREPWSPGGVAAIDQLRAKAIDELRKSEAFYLIVVRERPWPDDEWGAVIAGSAGAEENAHAILYALEHSAGELRAKLEEDAA